jgi:hypothetical protein
MPTVWQIVTQGIWSGMKEALEPGYLNFCEQQK